MTSRGVSARRGKLFLYALPVVMVVVGWAALPAAAFTNVEAGAAAPAFTLKATTGEDVSLEGTKGKAVVLLFVRQGQDKSESALQDLRSLDVDVADQTAILAVVTNPEEGDAGAWAAQAGVKFPVLLDEGGTVYGLYGVRVSPSTGILDKEGVFKAEIGGYPRDYADEVVGGVKVALGLLTEEQLSEALEAPSRPATSEARKEAERMLERARLLEKRKMGAKALASAREAVAADDTFTDAHTYLGGLLLDDSEGNADEASGHFARALELEPKSSDAQVGMARVKSLKGDHEGAAEILSKAAQLNPRPEKLYYHLGLVYERAQDYPKAVEAYRKALEKLLE